MFTRLFLLFSIFSCTIPLISQVTIGIIEEPMKGALLDLRNIADAKDGEANANKGLILPRVSLISENKTYYEANKEEIDNEHIGLVVYNTNQIVIREDECTNEYEELPMGLVVWNGKKWDSLYQKEEVGESIIQTVEDHEGNKYIINTFGEQGTWMCENLRTKSYPPKYGETEIPLWFGTSSTISYGYPRTEFEAMITKSEDFEKYPSVGLLYTKSAAYAGSFKQLHRLLSMKLFSHYLNKIIA